MHINSTTSNQKINLLGQTVRKLGKNSNRIFTVNVPLTAKVTHINGQTVFVVRGQFSGRYVLA